MEVRVLIRSRPKDWVSWDSGRVIVMDTEESNIAAILALTPEEQLHSIAPINVSIEYKDGTQHNYTLAVCPACERAF